MYIYFQLDWYQLSSGFFFVKVRSGVNEHITYEYNTTALWTYERLTLLIMDDLYTVLER